MANSKPSSLSSSVKTDSLNNLSCSSALNLGVYDAFLELALLRFDCYEVARASLTLWDAPELPIAVCDAENCLILSYETG